MTASTLRFYVNGTQVSSVARTGSILTSTNPLQIGSDSIYGQYFNGLIDEVRIYNIALSAAQIQTDMTTPVEPSTPPPPDTTPPTNPSALTATAAGTTVNLSWTGSTDAGGVTGYEIERCQGTGCTTFTLLKTVTTTTTSDTGLTPNTTYSYRVRAKDATPNYSGYTNTATATTPAAADTTPPTNPSALTATAAGTTVNLSWTGSTDAGGVTGYEIERCQGTGCTTFTLLKTVTTTTTSDTGLTPNTTYSYRVRAKDATPNYSGYSNTATATTDPSGGTGGVSVQLVVQNPNFEALAVDSGGLTYGTSVTDDHSIWRSSDEGATWTKVRDFASNERVFRISALASGTLLAHVDGGTVSLYRSDDQGATWVQVLTLPGGPVFYTTLTADSITDGNGFVWLGTYNTGPDATYPNYIYRSADDGRTWQVVNTPTTHRHIHGVRFNPADGKLYVFFGDSAGDGIWVSSDDGSTLQPLCTAYTCTTVDGAFDPGGSFLIFGQDNYTSQNNIVKVSLETGALTQVLALPYDSFSAFRLDPTSYLVGTTHEQGVPIVDPNLHLYASVDGGDTFTDVFQKPIPAGSGRTDIRVQFRYPNGDFLIQASDYGTIVGRLVVDAPP